MGEAKRRRDMGSRSEVRRFHADLAAAHERDGQLRVVVEVVPVIDAMLDRRLLPHVVPVMKAAMQSIEPGGSEQVSECFGCCRLWSRENAPIAFALVEWLKTKQAGAMLICGDCCIDPGARAAVVRGLTRDFNLDPSTAQDVIGPRATQ